MIISDLHLHTYFSDGTLSPKAVVSLAKLRGLEVISITDHDTIDGVSEAIEAGKYYGVDVVSGVELSCEWQGLEVHILGYGIDIRNSELLSVLETRKTYRRKRLLEMLERLKDFGINISEEEVLSMAKGSAGRPHLAMVMLKKGIISSLREAYEKFIGKEAACYIPPKRMNVAEAVDLIRKASGVAVIAHPVFIPRQLLIDIIQKVPIWGLEVYYPEHSQRLVFEFMSICNEWGLIPTGGSDFHGEAKEQDYLGKVGLQWRWSLEDTGCYVSG